MPREIETAFGPLTPQAFSRLFPDPAVRIAECPWARPLRAILRACGWSIDQVISDPRTAREVRRVWRLWKVSRRLVAEQQRLNAIAEALWWREMGCPVPCPTCEVIESCDCDHRLTLSHARERGSQVLDSFNTRRGVIPLSYDPNSAYDGLPGL